MKKISFFFSSILLIVFTSFSTETSSNTNKPIERFIGCNNEISENYFINVDKIKIKKIEIDINNYKKWTVNNIKILTTRSRFISNDLKINFKGDVKITYEDNSICFLKARIRHSGDAKDHIAFKGNSVIQSLDVRLLNGNIRGITRFKLFKPDVRGNLDDVIILTQILRDFGYLAPRSIKVQARVNQTDSVMLFQEKAAKELIEFNNRREGPILEGDQKFFFKVVEDIPDNQLSNWSVGMPHLRNKSSKVMLSKLTNANLINRSKVHKEISLEAINNLNLIYLYWSNRFQDEKNNFFFFDYDLDNTLLSFFEPEKTKKLDIYNLFLQSTNSHHALSATNRKFYWNSIENYFEPILYDANPNIDLDFSTTTTKSARLPISNNFMSSFEILEEKLASVDIDKLKYNVNNSGLNLSNNELRSKIEKINKNLINIRKNFEKISKEEMVVHNNFKPINNILNKFNKNLSEIDPNVYLIQHSGEKLLKCKIYLENCEFYNIPDRDLVNLLEGELKIKNVHYQYIGKNIDLNILNLKNNSNIKNYKNAKIYYEKGIKVNIDEENNLIKIDQAKIGSKAFIVNGNLENVSIIFNGVKIPESKVENSFIPPNYPINHRGLTGCLSFININFKNINLTANNSSCEDTINFINTSGNINTISINNSFSDAFDADFSDLKINNLKISSAINDCTDFSAGKYELINLDLKNCGDKAISIGEKSNVKIEKINVNKADIGIATKDSSILSLKNASLENLRTCVSAYNKKQEFNGGFVKIENLTCKKFSNQFEIDQISKIVLKNNIQISKR